MTWILWIVSILLVAGFAISLNSIFAIKQRSLYLLSAHVWGLVQLVGVGQILSLTSRLNQPEAFLVVQAVFTVAAFVVWVLCKRPALMPVEWNLHELRTGWDTLRQEPLTFALTITAITVTTISLLYIFLLPQNLDDVLTAYLPRMATWLQTGEIRIVETSVYNFPQVTYPVAPQLTLFWVILFTKQVGLAAIVTWINVPLIATAIYVLGRHFGGTRKQAAISALLWMISPSVFELSFTLMADLQLITLVMTTVLFLLLGLEQKQNGLLVGSAVAFGLAIGSKEITFIMLPGALVMGVLWLWHYQHQWRRVIVWAVLAVVMVGLLGSFAYVNNYLYYGSPFGARDIETTTSNYGSINIGRLLNIFEAIPHFIKSSALFVRSLLVDSHPSSRIQGETILIYGLIGLALAYHLVDGWRQRDKRRLGIIAFILLYGLILFTVRDFTNANMRYLMTMTALGMAFITPLLGAPLQNLWSVAVDKLQKLPPLLVNIGAVIGMVILQGNSIRRIYEKLSEIETPDGLTYFFLMGPAVLMISVFVAWMVLKKPLSQQTVLQKINLLLGLNMVALACFGASFQLSGVEILPVGYLQTAALLMVNALVLMSIPFIKIPFPDDNQASVLPLSSPFYRFIMGMSIGIIVLRVLFSSVVPLVAKENILSMSRTDFETLYFAPNSFAGTIHTYHAHIQPTDRVGIMLPNKFPLSLLYGEDLSRPVAQIYPYPPVIDADYIRELGYDFVIIDGDLFDDASRARVGMIVENPDEACKDVCIYTLETDGLNLTPLDEFRRYWLLSLQD